jgi:CxxC motif-containing protein
MSERKELTCIECPRGCRLSVEVDGGRATVSGNACPKGAVWGAQEAVEPMRALTTTVAVEGSARKRLPVRTDGTIPLGRLLDAMAAIDPIVVRPPIRRGDVVARDLLGLGVDLIATDDLNGAER